MSNCPDDNALSALSAGLLPPDRVLAIEAHLSECTSCQVWAAEVARLFPAGAPAVQPGPQLDRLTPFEPRRGMLVGRYLLLDALGQGGMSSVFLAYDPELDRKVAVKLLRPDRPLAPVEQERTRAEGRALARLQHPNVVAVYDVGDAQGWTFIALQYVEGIHLGAWLALRRRSWREVLQVFEQAGRGLAAAHASGLVHRDFKPSNVLVAADAHAWVTDFGLARVEDTPGPGGPTTGPSRGADGGTPAYMAPEQRRGEAVDARSDQYSFCLALKQALATHGASTPRRVERVIERGLSREPGARFESMEALLHELSAHRARRRRAAWITVAAAFVGLTSLAVWRDRWMNRPAACSDFPQRVAAQWNDAKKAQVAARFASSGLPFAADAWKSAERQLDAQAQGLSGRQQIACWRVQHRAEPVALRRLLGLERCLGAFEASLAVLAQADAEVVRGAGSLVGALESPSRCEEGLLPQVPPQPAQAAQVARVRTSLARVHALEAAGKLEDARVLAEQQQRAAQALGYGPLSAEADLAYGRALLRLEQLEAATTALQQAQRAAVASGAEEVAVLATAELARLTGERLHQPEGGRSLTQLADAWLEHLGRPAQLQATLLAARAAIEGSDGKYALAEELSSQALDLLREKGAPASLRVAPLLDALATARRQQGHYDDALVPAREALEVRERDQGPEHPDTAQALENLGKLLSTLTRYDEALPAMERALKIRERAFAAGHPSIAASRMFLGTAYMMAGRHPQAAEVLTAAVEALRGATPPDRARTATALVNLGQAQLQLGRLSEAFDAASAALREREEVLGPRHPDTGVAAAVLGQVELEQGKLAPAAAHFERAHELLEEALGPDYPDLAGPLGGLGMVRVAQGDPKRAKPLLERALALMGETPSDPADRAFLELALARVLAGSDLPRARALALRASEGFGKGGPLARSKQAEAREWLHAHPGP